MKSVPTKENLMLYDDDDRSAEEALTEPDTDALDAGEQEGAGSLPALPSLALGGATLLTIGGFDVLAHLGPTGWLVGGIAAIIAARHGPSIIEGAKTWLALPAPVEDEEERPLRTPATPPALHRPTRSHRSILDRALGRFPEDEADVDDTPPRWQPAPDSRSALARHDGCLHLGGNFFPHANSVLSKRIAILGMSGSGKSNGLAVFVEELGTLADIGAPLVLADTDGEYRALCSRRYLLRPVYAHAGNLSPDNAFAFGHAILEHGYQVVLDLQSYDEDEATAALVMVELIRGLRAWEEAHANDNRLSCMFILDEAAVWLPQRAEESLLARERDSEGRTILSRLQRTFFNTVARRGRKQGIGFLFASQRPADLDKRCLSCNWFLLFRQTLPADLKAYAELGVPKDVAMALAEGEAWVIEPTGRQGVQQFRLRSSPDEGKSPGLPSLHKHVARWQQATGSGLPPMPELPTREMQVTPEPTPGMSAPKTAPAQPRRGNALVQRGVQAYLEGATSCPKLAAALDISSWDARQLMPKVQAVFQQMQQAEEEPDEES
jgi:hypothetical protein